VACRDPPHPSDLAASRPGELHVSTVIAVAGTSHSPMLGMEPERMWRLRAEQDRDIELYDAQGARRGYAELEAEAGNRYLAELTMPVWNDKYERAQNSIIRLRDGLAALAPDLLLVIGDDQEELFTPRNQPAMAVYYGAELETHQPVDMGSPLLEEVQRRLGMDGRVYPAHRGAGLHLISSLVREGFDVASSAATETGGGFGHAFAWVVGRLLRGIPIPAVPVLINTYYPPNQPLPSRCYDLGVALRRAVSSMPGGLRVAVVASGGLSHFVINRELDEKLLSAMRAHDEAALRTLPAGQLESGSSEIRNWIAAAGAASHLSAQWVDYIPAYRSSAGTGVGLAFGLWS
jgi:hypothetical protein